LVLPQDANVAAGKGKSHSAVPSPFLVSRSEPTAKAGRWLFGAMGTENAVGTCPWRPCTPRTKEVGDEVLLAFSRTMEQAFKHGFVSRFGGDEFIALFCGDVTREQVRQAISKFQHLLKEKSLTLQTGRVNASIGIAYDSTGVVPIDDLYQRADQALYAAKRQGKNCAVEWSPELKKELNDIAEGKKSGK